MDLTGTGAQVRDDLAAGDAAAVVAAVLVAHHGDEFCGAFGDPPWDDWKQPLHHLVGDFVLEGIG